MNAWGPPVAGERDTGGYMDTKLDANLSLDLVRAVESAAIAAARFVGRGDEQAADSAAAQAMRHSLRQVAIQGRIVVGDGPRGATPVLYVGETVGAGGTPADVAADPLECITRAARASPEAMSAIAIAEPGSFLHAPPVYMEKLTVGPGAASAELRMDDPPGDTVAKVGTALGKPASDVCVCILDRPRHAALIQAVRGAGARVRLIGDGDIVGAIAPSLMDSGIDIYMGVGGAPEGVLAAAALRGLGGRMLARFAPRHDDDLGLLKAAGITDPKRALTTEDLAAGEVIFAAAGVTSGAMLDAAQVSGRDALTHSVVIRSRTGSVRWLKTHHRLDDKGVRRT